MKSEEATSSGGVRIRLSLTGHLTEAALGVALDKADSELRSSTTRPALIVDCLTMTGYDSAARSRFIAWNSRHKRHFRCVVVLTTNKMWHMVVGSMSLASGQSMKAFSALSEAEVWLAKHPV